MSSRSAKIWISSFAIVVPYAVVNVEQGKRYRLRIFAIACRPFFTFSIDNHNITFMEADGIEHDPVEVQNIDVYTGTSFSHGAALSKS